MLKIDSHLISVIVQGPINGANEHSSKRGITYDCLKSIRKFLPNAEIILSTWAGANVDGLAFDKVVFNKDPKAHKFSKDSKTNSNNRVIVSTIGGLNVSSNQYCLKIRSDIMICSNDFLKYFDMFQERNNHFPLFERKVIACSKNTIRFFKKGKKFMFTPFHVSDWAYFGLTNDLKLLYNIDLAKEPQLSQYFKKNKRLKNKNDFFMDCNWQFPPEQYITYTAFKKKFPELKLNNKTDYNSTNIKQTDHVITNNFIVLEPKLWEFRVLKDPYYKECKYPITFEQILWDGMFRYTYYKKIYNKIFKTSYSTKPQTYELMRNIWNFIINIPNKLLKKIMK